jgi:hypothetical protein
MGDWSQGTTGMNPHHAHLLAAALQALGRRAVAPGQQALAGWQQGWSRQVRSLRCLLLLLLLLPLVMLLLVLPLVVLLLVLPLVMLLLPLAWRWPAPVKAGSEQELAQGWADFASSLQPQALRRHGGARSEREVAPRAVLREERQRSMQPEERLRGWLLRELRWGRCNLSPQVRAWSWREAAWRS